MGYFYGRNMRRILFAFFVALISGVSFGVEGYSLLYKDDKYECFFHEDISKNKNDIEVWLYFNELEKNTSTLHLKRFLCGKKKVQIFDEVRYASINLQGEAFGTIMKDAPYTSYVRPETYTDFEYKYFCNSKPAK